MATEFPIRANTKQAVQDVAELENALRKAGKEAGMTEKEINDIVGATKKAKNEGGKNLSDLNGGLSNINKTLKSGIGLLAGYFSVQQAKAFIGEVVKITSEFQKLEAVLTNTLGSKSQAQQVFAQIKKFASETPFSVLELTQSFVKLANQGFKPTQAELRKLGDLSASTGKQFDQLTEAIIDAQTGEFERLKEFGIRASKQGDQVVFTFKGVQTQVDFTADSIREYILTLGDAEGVSGAMEAISKTLGGQISNLGDTWDDLLNTIGDGNSRVLSGTVQLFADILAGIKSIIITEEQLEEARIQRQRLQGIENFQAFAKAYDDIDKALRVYLADNEREIDQLRELNDQTVRKKDFDVDEVNRRVDRINALKEENKAVKEYVEVIQKEGEQKAKADADKAKAARLVKEKEHVDELTKAYAKLTALTTEFLSDQEIQRVAGNVKLTDRAIAELQNQFFPTGGKAGDLSPEAEEGLTDDELDTIKKSRDARREAEEAERVAIDNLKNYSIDAFEEIFRSRVIQSQRELALLENQYHHELGLVGNNEAAKAKLTREFEQRRIQVMNKQAAQEQTLAIFSMLANQGPAIVKAIATSPWPINLGIGLVIAGLIGTQISNQNKIQTPRFAAEGDFDIKGPGTETSDSIPYMLSVGESVTPAAKTRKFGWLLGPMIENKNFNEYDLRNLVDQTLPNNYNPVFVNQSHSMLSEEALERHTEQIVKAIKMKSETHINFDHEGITLWRETENRRTKILNRHFSI